MMFSKFFDFTFFVLLALSTVFVNRGYTHDSYPADFDLPASTYADVEGSISRIRPLYPEGQTIHIHGIVYSFDDDKVVGGHANGNYTLVLEVSAPKEGAKYDDDWWEEDFASEIPVPKLGSFDDGIRVEDDISITANNLSGVRAVEYKASATVENGVGIERDFIEKPVGQVNEVTGIGNNNIGTSNTGISLPTQARHINLATVSR